MFKTNFKQQIGQIYLYIFNLFNLKNFKMRIFTLLLSAMFVGLLAYGQPTSGFLDFGTSNSQLTRGHTKITERTSNNNFRWTNRTSLSSRDRGRTSGVNEANRDLIQSSKPRTFEARVKNGTYNVRVTFGDRNFRHDRMRVRAETGANAVTRGNITTNAKQFKTVRFNVQVRDGRLTLRFYDDGGSDANWAVTRVIFEQLVPIGRGKLGNVNDIQEMTVYPNPANEMLTVAFESPATSTGTLQIHDLAGRIVSEPQNIAELDNTVQVQVDHLNAGVYMVNVVLEDGTVFTKRFNKTDK